MVYMVIEGRSDDARRLLNHYKHKLPEAMQKATGRLMEGILKRSFQDVPRDKGVLENSGFSYLTKTGDTVQGVIGYKAISRKKSKKWPNFNYAPIQHERCDFKHPRKGKCHYLSDPIEEMKDKWDDYVIQELKMTFRV